MNRELHDVFCRPGATFISYRPGFDPGRKFESADFGIQIEPFNVLLHRFVDVFFYALGAAASRNLSRSAELKARRADMFVP